MANKPRDELDELIDTALCGYSDAEPLEGLEQRVLQRIRVHGRAPRRPWWVRPVFAVPALAALLVAAVVLRPTGKALAPAAHQAPRRAAPPQLAFNPPSPPRPMKPKLHRRTVSRAALAAVPVDALPKQDRFPVPAPLSAEEHALLAWARRDPAEARQVFADLRKRTSEPVSIQEIQIQPLPSDGSQ